MSLFMKKKGNLEFEVSVKKGPLMTHGFGDVLTTNMIVILMIEWYRWYNCCGSLVKIQH